MLSIWTRGASLCLLALLASGCLDFSFGSDSTEVTGCSVATPHSAGRDLESRYALGSHTTLYLSDLDNPQVASSDPEIVAVGPIEDDETDEDGDKLVGLTESGTQVWNIDPILSPEGGGLYFGSFEYVHDPDARPIKLTAFSFAGSAVGALDPIETTFQGEPTREGRSFFSFASVGGRTPLMALSSLLLMTLALQLGIRRRSPGSD